MSGGSLPPLAASLLITCLCSQIFMLALSLLSPVKPSSCASSFRADRLESISSAFIRSTMEVRHSSFSPFDFTAASRIGATSTLAAGPPAEDELAGAAPEDGAAAPPDVGAVPADGAPAGAVALALPPKIALMILPKMLIRSSNACEDRPQDRDQA